MSEIMSAVRQASKKLTPYLSVLLVVAMSACGSVNLIDVLNKATPRSGYDLTENLAYGDHPRQRMDIYTPLKPSENSKVVVFVYGGAWREGNRSEYEFVGHALSNAGHYAVVPDYRLFPEVSYPSFIVDIVDAIKTLQTSDIIPEELLADQMVLMGHSSGAHVAALLSADRQYLDDTNQNILALVAMSGPYELPLDNPEVTPVFKNVTDASTVQPPMLAKRSHPKTLLIHGTDDERVLPFHSSVYHAALQALGVSSKLYLLESEDHASVIAGMATRLNKINQSQELIFEFLDAL